jgi:hypothetical protein
LHQRIYREDGGYDLAGDEARENPHGPYNKVTLFRFEKGLAPTGSELLIERWGE